MDRAEEALFLPPHEEAKTGMKQAFSVVSSEVLLRARAECLLAPLGVLFELDTVADCMADPVIRPFFGRCLQKELMPRMEKEGRDEAVIAACRYLAFKPASLRVNDLMDGALESFRLYLLPLINEDTPCLTLSLCALIMLLAGVRRSENGYTLVGSDGSPIEMTMDQEALSSFSRLSCDMDAESLAYAALADERIWGRDLREDEGLEDRCARCLTDIQLLGLSETLKRTAAL